MYQTLESRKDFLPKPAQELSPDGQLLLFSSREVLAESLQYRELQHARFPCPSLSPKVCSCSMSRRCLPTIISSFTLFSFSHCQGLFQWFRCSHQVAKLLEHQLQHQSFQGILRTNFLYDWLFFFLLAVQGTLKSLLQHHSSKASVLQCSASFWSNFHIHTWLQENHSFDYMDLCWQSNVSLFNMLSNQIISFLKSSLTLKSALLINLVIPQLEDFLLYLFTF